jgi:hypothetical protein
MTACDLTKVTVMRFRLYVLAAMLVLLMTACAPPANLRDPNNLKDKSLLTDDPCAAPCWRNIIPGETAWRDMTVAIEDDAQFTGADEVKDEASEARVLNFSTKDGNAPCCRVYSTQDGKTVGQVLTLLAPDQITLGEVIEKYGDPTYGTGSEVSSDQALVVLVYPDVPIIIYVFAAGMTAGELTADSPVIGTIYLQQADVAEILKNADLYNWDGYTTLATWLDGNFDLKAAATAEAGADSTAEAAPDGTAEAVQDATAEAPAATAEAGS